MAAMPLTPGLSIVIPVYNGALTVGELTAQLVQLLPRLSERYEILLVNDGSRDASWQVVVA